MTEKEKEQVAQERSYILKHIPDDLWFACRTKALNERRSMREVLIEALKTYIGQE